MTDEFRTHDACSAIDDELVEPTPLERARWEVANRFPAAAERIAKGEWDNGPWIQNALAKHTG